MFINVHCLVHHFLGPPPPSHFIKTALRELGAVQKPILTYLVVINNEPATFSVSFVSTLFPDVPMITSGFSHCLVLSYGL
jgi:hypothetical protein